MAKQVNLVVAAAATLASAASVPVAASPVQDAYYAHTRSCIALFFSDKDAHTAECLPNTSGNIGANNGSGGNNQPPPPPPPVVVVVAPPPPPVVIPGPEVGSSYPEAGSSYPEAGSSYPEAGSSYPEAENLA